MSPQRKSRRFYPTRLAIALASGTSGCPPEPDARGFVVVETNYRIYAYTGLSPDVPKCPRGVTRDPGTPPTFTDRLSHSVPLCPRCSSLPVLTPVSPCPPLSLCPHCPLVPVSPDSELQVALIALFSELLYRFPNLVVAQVTRDSVQAAIANGITADQVGTPGTRRGGQRGGDMEGTQGTQGR